MTFMPGGPLLLRPLYPPMNLRRGGESVRRRGKYTGLKTLLH